MGRLFKDNQRKWGDYVDKKRSDIERDVREEFDRTDKLIIRDDQEIYNAWLTMIEEYMDEVLESDRLIRKERYIVWRDWKPVLFTYKNDYWKAARKYFIEAYNKIVDLHNNVTWLIKFTTDAEDNDLIRTVAIEIDNAENEALRKIEQYCNPMQGWDNASYHTTIKKDEGWTPVVNNWEIEREKPMFMQDKKTGIITFSDRCNNLSFVDMAKSSWLFYKTRQGQYPQYTIDYINCKNEKLRDKMKNLTWWFKWTLRYDAEQKIYYIKWSNWSEVKASSIWIWEWVTFRRREIEADEAHEKDQKRKEKLWKVEVEVDSEISPEKDPELKKYVDDIPENLRAALRELWTKEYRKFIIETENRLAAVLREYKYYNYELHTNPISSSSSWLFEINFISRDYERSVDLWEDGYRDLGPKIFSLFQNINFQDVGDFGSEISSKSNFKSEYEKYLKKRIPVKWNEIDELASRENLIWMDYPRSSNIIEEEKISAEKIECINYWIYLLKTFIQNHRNSEWNSYIDNDDRNLTGMLEDLKNLEATMQQDVNLVHKGLIFWIINDTALKLTERWYKYTYWIQYKKYLYEDFRSIIVSDDNNVKFTTLRNLWYRSCWADWTTAFLADEISKSDVKDTKIRNEDWLEERVFYAESRLEINDTELNERFNYINGCLYTQIEFDWNWDLKRTPAMDKIDRLYKCSNDTSWKKIAEELNKMWILPDSWVEDGDVLDKCKEIAENLKNKQKNIAKNFNLDVIKKWVSDQRVKLESKYPRLPEEDEELIKLKYYDEHPDEAEEYYKASLECMKSTLRYYGINNEIACSFAPIFVEEGGWAKGKMWEMYNDIIWYWFWDLSDKTAAVLQNVIVTIMISTLTWLAISSFVSLLGSYLAVKFPWLVEVLESIKVAVSTKLAKLVSLWWMKWKLLNICIEIIKKYKVWLVGFKNVFVNNFRAWIPLDGWFWLDHHMLSSVLLMSIAYLSWVVGQFWHLFWDKISDYLENISRKFVEHPERWDNLAKATESLTEIASKEWLKSIKNMVFSSWDDEVVLESNFENWLVCLDNNIRSSDDKQKLSRLADSKMKFHLSTDVIDEETLGSTWSKKMIDAVDLMCVVQNMLALKIKAPDVFRKYSGEIENWNLKLHLSTEPWKVYLQDPRTWKIASFSDLSNWWQLI